MPEPKKEHREETLYRISGTDIPGNLTIYAGLTKIKGISWSFSNAICKSVGIDKNRKVSTLTDNETEKIMEAIKSSKMPAWLLNRKSDPETGKGRHLITTELDLQKEFDIRKMKKIKSYKGIRHLLGQPVRGQRTRSHFRRKGPSIGVKRAKISSKK